MHKIIIFLFSLALSVLLVSEEKNIEDCTLITEDDSRLICFDSFFKEDTSMILVNKEDIAIYEEKNSLEPEEFNTEKTKIVLKTERSIINDNLILNGIRLSGGDFIFELNDKSSWRSIENLRKKKANSMPKSEFCEVRISYEVLLVEYKKNNHLNLWNLCFYLM